MTNLGVVTAALLALGVIDESMTPTAEQGQNGLRSLNQMMAMWTDDGITFPSWFTQTSLAATCPIPEFAELAVINNLGVLLATVYPLSVSAALASVAESSYDAINRKRFLQGLQPSVSSAPIGEADVYRESILG